MHLLIRCQMRNAWLFSWGCLKKAWGRQKNVKMDESLYPNFKIVVILKSIFA